MRKLEMMLFLEQADCHMRMMAARKTSKNRKVVEGGEREPGGASSVKQEDEEEEEDKMDCTLDELFNPDKAELGEALRRVSPGAGF